MQITPRLTEHSATPSRVSPTLTLIENDEIEEAWPLVEPLLKKAIARSYGETTLHAEYEKLLQGETSLWMVTLAGRPIAAATTYFHRYPRKTVMVVGLLGGESMDAWLHLQPQMIAFAKTNGATALQSEVRPGLTRILGKIGWQKVRTIIRRDF